MEFAKEETARLFSISRLRILGGRYYPGCIALAVGTDNRQAIKWAREIGCPWYGHEIIAGVESGNTEQIMWLRSQGCPWSDQGFDYAIKRGNLQLVQWLWEEGHRWSVETLYTAVKDGHDGIANWMIRKSGSKACECVLDDVIEEGRLEILKIIIEGNPFLHIQALESAEYFDKDEIVAYLQSPK